MSCYIHGLYDRTGWNPLSHHRRDVTGKKSSVPDLFSVEDGMLFLKCTSWTSIELVTPNRSNWIKKKSQLEMIGNYVKFCVSFDNIVQSKSIVQWNICKTEEKESTFLLTIKKSRSLAFSSIAKAWVRNTEKMAETIKKQTHVHTQNDYSQVR